MGYGEIGGGGSVHWLIHHGGNGQAVADPNGGARGAHGRDPLPPRTQPGTFTIRVEGRVIWTGRIDYNNVRQIEIFWDEDRVELAAAEADKFRQEFPLPGTGV